MRIYDLLHKKRVGAELTEEELSFFVREYTAGNLPDYQASAWLMAVACRGMTLRETAALTEAMMHSGDTVDLSAFGERSVDKHSTGGVGDKTSLILSPIVAAEGGFVAKMSGRGLGHTGGTIDKLEAIPGYRTTLTREEFLFQVGRVHMAIIGQSGNLAPADKKLYALRDVTATVDSIPLIASSIMSKKLAAGAHSIVLDVKVGSGAFMKTEEEGRALAQAMVEVGRACGRRVCACLSDMDLPLGLAIGNACEVNEAAAVLRGEGPRDLREVCLALSAEMLSLCLSIPTEEARARAEAALDSGRALAAAERWIAAQGGDPAVLTDSTRLPLRACESVITAEQDGYLTHMDAERIGVAAMLLGAGRLRLGEEIDPAAGILLTAKTGAYLKRGDPIARLYTNRPAMREEACAVFRAALRFGEEAPQARPLIRSVIR